jgi:hypothetical protein
MFLYIALHILTDIVHHQVFKIVAIPNCLYVFYVSGIEYSACLPHVF